MMLRSQMQEAYAQPRQSPRYRRQAIEQIGVDDVPRHLRFVSRTRLSKSSQRESNAASIIVGLVITAWPIALAWEVVVQVLQALRPVCLHLGVVVVGFHWRLRVGSAGNLDID